jgi:hypothetical protein
VNVDESRKGQSVKRLRSLDINCPDVSCPTRKRRAG